MADGKCIHTRVVGKMDIMINDTEWTESEENQVLPFSSGQNKYHTSDSGTNHTGEGTRPRILVPTEKITERYQLLMAKSVVNEENNCISIRVLNPSEN
ncbi:hypothetical protein CHS0354_035575 [Potamilus streckersoni]|uniref:Uncharacterized protein n=1 Tax=Potamilus streckersoni TaxID=2493646 RepID=A0AAE0VJB0_9BIVA|nr:hypothetical protein CHS0354_035575 [Potamilus streckersoni]